MDTTAVATPPPAVPTAETGFERPNYLNAAYGLRSWLLTRDHKRIAILYLISVTVFFALGSLFALMIRLELLTPEGDLMQPDTYNRMFTMHGIVMVFFFLIPAIPAVLGNFLVPLMIGAKDLAFPRLNLASWYVYNLGGIFTLWAIVHGGVDTGWTFYTPLSHELLQHLRHLDRSGRLHQRLLVDLHGPELHRHHPPDARAGPHLVPAAAVHLVPLRDQPDHRAGHAGGRHHHPARGARAAAPPGDLRSAAGRRPDPLPAPVLVLLPPGGVHHDPAGHGRRQRAGGRLRAQTRVRLQGGGLRQRRHRGPRLPGLGTPHVRLRPVDLRLDHLLGALHAGGGPLGGEGVQLDGHPVRRIDLVPDARCSTPWASSACSRSAASPG